MNHYSLNKHGHVLSAALMLVLPLCGGCTASEQRPQPLRTLNTEVVLHAQDFGAVPDDGQDDWEAIGRAFAQMHTISVDEHRSVKLVIAPGTYDLTPDKRSNFCFSLQDLSSFEVDATGATFMVSSPVHGLLSVRNCRDGIFRGFTVDYTTLPFTQGTIGEVSPSTTSFRFTPDAGYPLPDAWNFVESKTRWGSLFTADGKRLKDGVPNLVPVVCSTPNGDGTYTIRTKKHVMNELVQGDRLAIIARYNGRALYSITDSHQISFINMTTYACPAGGYGVRSSMVNILGCTIRKKEGRLISQNADCVHVTPGEYGPWIEDCHFEGQQDDAINIKTELVKIREEISKDTYLVAGNVREGHRLRLYEPQEGHMEGWYTVQKLEKSGRYSRITLDHAVACEVRVGMDKTCHMFFNDNIANRGFVIRNNVFCNSRRYAMLIQAVDGFITGNRMMYTSTAGIVLQNSAGWPEGFVPRNIVIRDNYIDHCGFDGTFQHTATDHAPVLMRTTTCSKTPAVWCGIENITFENNTVISPQSPAAILSGVSCSTFRHNTFQVQGDAIVQSNCQDITID